MVYDDFLSKYINYMHQICNCVRQSGDDADDATVMLKAWLFGEVCTDRLAYVVYEDLLKEIDDVVFDIFIM